MELEGIKSIHWRRIPSAAAPVYQSSFDWARFEGTLLRKVIGAAMCEHPTCGVEIERWHGSSAVSPYSIKITRALFAELAYVHACQEGMNDAGTNNSSPVSAEA